MSFECDAHDPLGRGIEVLAVQEHRDAHLPAGERQPVPCARRRQDLARAIINDATAQKIAAVKVTVSKGSQVCA